MAGIGAASAEAYFLSGGAIVGGAAVVLLGTGLLEGARVVERFEEGRYGWELVALKVAKWALASLAVIFGVTGMACTLSGCVLMGAASFTPFMNPMAHLPLAAGIGVVFGVPALYYGVKIVQTVSERLFDFRGRFARIL